MNAKVAKRIRKCIFGDQSRRATDYGLLQIPGRRGRITGQLVCRGLRERYKSAKKFYKEARREARSPAWIFKVMSIEGEGARRIAAGSIGGAHA